ncbi:MAG TPA: phosphonate ABC transporter, permease protein PhnE [Candidatus Methylomirabilis sp.]|nr:phosphonate ABC transporter, permease protein PhnE [Candidatus Methylomirabilis sp.]
MAPPPFEAALPSSDRSKSWFPTLFGICFAAAFVGSWQLAQVQPGLLFEAEGRRNMAKFIAGMFPPAVSQDFLRLLWVPLLETIQISVMGTVLAIAIGFPLGILGTASLAHAGPLHDLEIGGSRARRLLRMLPYMAARAVLSIFRSIPEFVWAFMFVRAVGLGPFPGVLAIGVSYGGMLGKVYSEILENLGTEWNEALQSTGASRWKVLVYGMLPPAMPQLVSYTLYRWECAVRASAILGFIGAGGLGQQIELSMRMFDFHEVVTLVVILFLLVAVVDFLSAKARKAVA